MRVVTSFRNKVKQMREEGGEGLVDDEGEEGEELNHHHLMHTCGTRPMRSPWGPDPSWMLIKDLVHIGHEVHEVHHDAPHGDLQVEEHHEDRLSHPPHLRIIPKPCSSPSLSRRPSWKSRSVQRNNFGFQMYWWKIIESRYIGISEIIGNLSIS